MLPSLETTKNNISQMSVGEKEEMLEKMRKEMMGRQRALTRNKNVNRHILIANAILRKANGKPIIGRKYEEWLRHTQEADRLIERYNNNPIN